MNRWRKDKFLAKPENRYCCYCGSDKDLTIDHFPPRTFFPDGKVPQGYLFPACQRCNRLKSKYEPVQALLVSLTRFYTDRNDKEDSNGKIEIHKILSQPSLLLNPAYRSSLKQSRVFKDSIVSLFSKNTEFRAILRQLLFKLNFYEARDFIRRAYLFPDVTKLLLSVRRSDPNFYKTFEVLSPVSSKHELAKIYGSSDNMEDLGLKNHSAIFLHPSEARMKLFSCLCVWFSQIAWFKHFKQVFHGRICWGTLPVIVPNDSLVERMLRRLPGQPKLEWNRQSCRKYFDYSFFDLKNVVLYIMRFGNSQLLYTIFAIPEDVEWNNLSSRLLYALTDKSPYYMTPEIGYGKALFTGEGNQRFYAPCK